MVVIKASTEFQWHVIREQFIHDFVINEKWKIIDNSVNSLTIKLGTDVKKLIRPPLKPL